MVATAKTATQLLTPQQTAELLQVRYQTLANWRLAGRGPKFVRVGSRIRYRPKDLDAWLAKGGK